MKCSEEECDNDISPRSHTGICKKCLVRKNYDRTYKSHKYRIPAICYKCGRNFMARYDQDPKRSWCPECRKKMKKISRGMEWVGRKSNYG